MTKKFWLKDFRSMFFLRGRQKSGANLDAHIDIRRKNLKSNLLYHSCPIYVVHIHAIISGINFQRLLNLFYEKSDVQEITPPPSTIAPVRNSPPPPIPGSSCC